MAIKQHLKIRSNILKGRVTKYAMLGLGISFFSILFASILVSYQLTGFIDFAGVVLAQKRNPAIWALDLTPFMFAYWGQSFCYELVTTMETLLEDKTRDLLNTSRELELKLQYETNHDHLTNLPNQRLLSQRINQGIKQVRENEALAVLILHIKGFKEINVQYGTFNANSLLVQFAEKLKSILLEPYLLQAYMGMNLVARMQGAEFAILIPRLLKEHHIEDMLTKIASATSAKFMIDGNSVKISTAIGVALYPQHGKNDLDLMRRATSSVFSAEKEDKPYVIFHEGMNNNKPLNGLQQSDLEDALVKGNLELLFQPDVNLKTQQIVGAEAHLKFLDKDQDVFDADVLTSLVESASLSKKITSFMLEKAIQQLAIWHKNNHAMYIAVNVYDATDVELPGFIDNLLKTHGVSAEFLKLELTEKTCLSDQTHTIDVLDQLAKLGLKLTICDFCSGYSSFIYLTNFPVSEIKIDKSFVANMMHDEKKQNILRAVPKLAKVMKLLVYAGGICDGDMAKMLKDMGYVCGQGPYFSAPVSPEEILTMSSKQQDQSTKNVT